MRLTVALMALAVLASSVTAGCLSEERPLTAKPPGCWYFGAATIPGMYEGLGQVSEQGGLQTASRPTGPSLPLQGLDLSLSPENVSLGSVERTVDFGDPHRRVLLTLEAAGGEEAYLTALVWKDNGRQEVAELSVPFLANTTTAESEQVEAWASRLADAREETDRFPPTHGIAVDRPAGAESDGYVHNVTIDPSFRLAELAENLSERWDQRSGQSRPYNLGWTWPQEGTEWRFAFTVATRIASADVDGNRFLLDVGASDETFAYAADGAAFGPNQEEQERSFIEEGFRRLGLPDHRQIEPPGGRVC